MTDTPIIDAALRKAIAPGGNIEDVCLRFLRAALPWEPSPETMEAMARGMCHDVAARSRKELLGSESLAISAYRANPIMRELYPEGFR